MFEKMSQNIFGHFVRLEESIKWFILSPTEEKVDTSLGLSEKMFSIALLSPKPYFAMFKMSFF